MRRFSWSLLAVFLVPLLAVALMAPLSADAGRRGSDRYEHDDEVHSHPPICICHVDEETVTAEEICVPSYREAKQVRREHKHHPLDHKDGECVAPEPEICDDTIDNDLDRKIDCDDVDCHGIDICILPDPEAICDDLRDNDRDALTDCQDPDCEGLIGASPPDCTDDTESRMCRYMDKMHAKMERDDERAARRRHAHGDREYQHRHKRRKHKLPTGVCQAIEDICDDEFDNDADGDVDCADPECEADASCQPEPLP